MKTHRVAATFYAALTGVVVAFQVALAIGAPWGAYTMGGAHPGQLPAELRGTAVVQAVLLAVLAAIVSARAAMGFSFLARSARWLIWIVVTICALSLLLNLVTPSAGERKIWGPVALGLLVTSIVVATRRPSPDDAA